MEKLNFITAEEALPLRQRVLRPGCDLNAVRYTEDELSQSFSFHLAGYEQGHIVAIASVYMQDQPERSEGDTWRLRGMATAPEHRGTGIGGQVLQACLREVERRSGRSLWCHARQGASGFYLRYGFVITSELYEIATIGPHYRMRRVVPLALDSAT